MTEHIEDYLNISEPIGYDNSVTNVEYISQDPATGTNLNRTGTTITITVNPSSDWLLPCESYLYIEGKVLKADGSRIEPIADKVWPDVALINNFFPYMFNTMTYFINNDTIESFNSPGQCTTIKHLLTKPKMYNGLDVGWELDTYDGQVAFTDLMYTRMPAFTPSDFMVVLPAGPTRDETVAFLRRLIPIFNTINTTVPVGELSNAEIQAKIAGANLAAADLINLANLFIDRFNRDIDAPEIPACVAAGTSVARDDVVDYFNLQIITALNVSLSKLTTDVNRYNTGYKKRKNLLFDIASNVMLNDNAGDFSFRIPLSYLFNFCEDYRKVMFNCKHELQLTRQTEYMPVFKPITISYDCIVQLDLLRWYMPKITPNLNMQELMLTQIRDNVTVDLAFMNKKIDVSYIPPGLTSFKADITYSAGVEKPRYLVAAFQTINTADPGANNDQYINYAIFNGTNLSGTNNLMIDVNRVDVKINGTSYNLMEYNNNANQNRIARWYNEYKKFKKSFRGDFSEDDMISFYEFRNLYRLYVFDISKQVEQLMSTGIANVGLEFQFNLPSTPQPATMKTVLYVVSFFDRVWKLTSDGTKQTIIK